MTTPSSNSGTQSDSGNGFAAPFARACNSSGIQLKQIAKLAGISYGALWSFLSGRGSPRARTLSGIATALQTTVSDILDGKYNGGASEAATNPTPSCKPAGLKQPDPIARITIEIVIHSGTAPEVKVTHA